MRNYFFLILLLCVLVTLPSRASQSPAPAGSSGGKWGVRVLALCGAAFLVAFAEEQSNGGVSRSFSDPQNLVESYETTNKRRGDNRQKLFDDRIKEVGNSSEKSRERFEKNVRTLLERKASGDDTGGILQEVKFYSLYLTEGKDIPLNVLLDILEEQEMDSVAGKKVLSENFPQDRQFALIRQTREMLTYGIVGGLFNEVLNSKDSRLYMDGDHSFYFFPKFGKEAPFYIRNRDRLYHLPKMLFNLDDKSLESRMAVLKQAIEKAKAILN